MSTLYERKAQFASELLQPLVKATDPAIKEVRYERRPIADTQYFDEVVVIEFTEGYTLPVNVNADSFLAMSRDVLRVLD